MRNAGLLWLALLATGVAGAQGSPGDVIRECAMRIAPDRTGLSQLEQDCAPLQPALQFSGLRQLIAESSRQRMDRDSLRQLLPLLRQAAHPAPAVPPLAPVLRNLRLDTPPQSWWEHLQQWLIRHLQGSQSGLPLQWLARWLQGLSLSRLAGEIIFGAATAFVLIAAGVVIGREIRLTRRASSGPPSRRGHLPAVSAEDPARTLAQLHQEPLAARPALLFSLLAERLAAVGRLPADRSLTHRELARGVRMDEPAERALWQRLAAIAEQQLYSNSRDLPPDALCVLNGAEDLYVAGWAPRRGSS